MPTLTCPSPGNINPLRLGAYQFSIAKLPDLTYFIQSSAIPDINLGVITQASSVHDVKVPGETMEYDTLSITFQVDEEMTNWNSIYFWMYGLGYPDDQITYRNFLNQMVNSQSLGELAKGYSDGTLTILDSSNNPKQIYTFVDMFPTSLSGLRFDATQNSAEIAIATATFEYSMYTINKPQPI